MITALKYLINSLFYVITLKYSITALRYLIKPQFLIDHPVIFDHSLKYLIKSLFYLITLKYLITALKASFGNFGHIISRSHIPCNWHSRLFNSRSRKVSAIWSNSRKTIPLKQMLRLANCRPNILSPSHIFSATQIPQCSSVSRVFLSKISDSSASVM